jgi:hypothetical protein
MRHLLTLLFTFAFIANAQAYIGPGPGLVMLGPLFTLVGGVLIALFMVLAYPIRLLLKRRKAHKK